MQTSLGEHTMTQHSLKLPMSDTAKDLSTGAVKKGKEKEERKKKEKKGQRTKKRLGYGEETM